MTCPPWPTTYHMAAGLAGAAALAINAGVDMAMLPFAPTSGRPLSSRTWPTTASP